MNPTPMVPVLIVSYFFPPLGGAGTQRPAKFGKWLPKFGYRPVVVAADPQERPASAPLDDPSLGDEVRDLVVYRVPPGVGPRLSPWRRLALALRFRQDDEEWVARARPVVDQAIREHAPAAVLISVSPYAAAELGPFIARRHRLPWLLDLRDPWMLDGWFGPATFIHAAWHRQAMRQALRAANMVIANTPAAREAYLAMTGLPRQRIWTIPNGYDPDDFTRARQGPLTTGRPDVPDRFTLIHVGTLHSVNPRAQGSIRRLIRGRGEIIDETGRSGRYLYEAVGLLKQRRPDLFAKLRVELVGRVHPSHQDLALTLGITSAIESGGYLSHTAALQRIVAADAVFVPLHNVLGSPPLIVPGKTYEAIASGRFVLACLPEGDAARLIRMVGAGAVCRPDGAAAIARQLEDLLAQWAAGRPLSGAPPGTIEPFAREQLASRLARALDTVRGLREPEDLTDPWSHTAGHLSAQGRPPVTRETAPHTPRPAAAEVAGT